MILVTGAAGFIGSCFAARLLDDGYQHLVLVDDFSREDKLPNHRDKPHCVRVDRSALFDWLNQLDTPPAWVVHLGARTDTTEQDSRIFDTLNLDYSRRLWQWCARQGVPLLYASSAATYGMGEQGFGDDHASIPGLQPLNPYGASKQAFDRWVLAQEARPPRWAGLKFFNVYGPNEYHKGRMASVVFHAFRQIGATGQMRLFRSHRPDIGDGQQARDFIYVEDVCDVLRFLMECPGLEGIYNLGTGEARTFEALAQAVFAAMGLPPQIDYIDTPADIRDTYQYFTQADMGKLRRLGYARPFTGLEEGVEAYVRQFLIPKRYR
ncbi:MAG: ADP-glyceromanno-heptose 6-epimerase [Bacteroidia bacterium]